MAEIRITEKRRRNLLPLILGALLLLALAGWCATRNGDDAADAGDTARIDTAAAAAAPADGATTSVTDSAAAPAAAPTR